MTIDLVEHAGKDFVFDSWERNKFEFVCFFVKEDELSEGFSDWFRE